jgi:hypothetical protein
VCLYVSVRRTHIESSSPDLQTQRFQRSDCVMSGKVFKLEKIAQCVQLLDELAVSGLATQAFAQARGLRYTQLRAWQNHQVRWRARLAGQEMAKPACRASGFVQVKAGAVAAATAGSAPLDEQRIRIDCTHGGRSAVVHWPLEACVQCAQWLAAYLA